MLEFDEDTTRLLDQVYAGSDFAARRRVSFDALRVRPGDSVVDIGCGNGLMLPDLARAAGTEGQVIGVDPSDQMRASAQSRCVDLPGVILKSGTAADLPVEDATADRALSVQVFEYIADIPPCLAEVARVLRPGGRLVIGDMHFGTFCWHSDDADRMAAMMASWEQHAAHLDAPALLPGMMVQAGFEVEEVRTITLCDHLLRPDGLARAMISLMAAYAKKQKHLSERDVDAWADEQAQLAREGRFFFSLTHYVTVARRI